MTPPTDSSGTPPPEHLFVIGLRKCGEGLLSLGSVLSCVLMLALFVIGFWLIVQAVVANGRFLIDHPVGHSAPSTGNDPRHITVAILHGLEFFFLAPLPALVFVSLARFFRSFGVASGAPTSAIDEARCSNRLHRVKALVVGLMAASVASDLLGRSLQGLSLEATIAESIALIVLVLFWYALERSCSHKAHD